MRKAYRELSQSGRYHRRRALRQNRVELQETPKKRPRDEAPSDPYVKLDVSEEDLQLNQETVHNYHQQDGPDTGVIDEMEVLNISRLKDEAENSCNNSNNSDSEEGESETNIENYGSDSIDDDEEDSDMESSHISNTDRSDTESDDSCMSDNEDDGKKDEIPRSRYKEPLYHGAPLTVEHSLLLVLALVLKHNLTGSCIEDILTVIHLHCLTRDLKRMSLYHFNKCFSLMKAKYSKHYYCTNCLLPLESERKNCLKCPPGKQNSYFIQLSIPSQIREMLSREGFYQSLQYRFNRQKNDYDRFEDIYDGEIYKNIQKEGYLLNSHEISMTWYTDGVPVFKSSNISIWPVYLRINELPYKQRILRENTIIAGLWFGSKKPNGKIFIKSFYPDFEELHRGIQCNIPGVQLLVNITSILLCGVCDLQAKSLFLNLKQFSGDFGCCFSEVKGKTQKLSTGGHTHVYLYEENFTLRAKEQTLKHAKEASRLTYENRKPESVKGVKGVCALDPLMPDYIASCAIDILHALDEGVFKKLLILWCDSTFSKEGFSLRNVLGLIDEKLKYIKFPKFIHRSQRKLSDYIHWKASELKFFFFMGPIILSEFLKPHLFVHYLFLVKGISLLMSDSISDVDIEIATGFLHSFVKNFPKFYDEKHCSINLHVLLHLPDCVRRFGPLWIHSCYTYEDMNGRILKLIHGTTNIGSQVVNSHIRLLSFSKQLLELPTGPLRDFATQRKRQVQIKENCGNYHTVGSYMKLCSTDRSIRAALKNIMKDGAVVQKYDRILKNGIIYISARYTRSLNSNSSFVLYRNHNTQLLGHIQSFVKLTYCQCMNNKCKCIGEHFAILRKVITQSELGDEFSRVSLPYIRKCYIGDETIVVSVNDLLSVCIYININDQSYVAQSVNVIEPE